MYSSYTAAGFARKHDLAERHGVNLEGALTWAFEFEDQPYFAGFRVLATNGIDLPVLNVFRMFSQMGGQRVAATSDGAVDLDAMMKTGVRDKPDVAALASRDANTLTVLAWHYHDDDVAGPDAAVTLSLEGLGAEAGEGKAPALPHRCRAQQRVHRVATARIARGTFTGAIRTARDGKSADAARRAPASLDVTGGRASLQVALPRQAVSLIVVEW